jgi:uncharacterized protein (TIGR02594 family)
MRAFAEIESGGRPSVQTGSDKGLFQLSEAEFAKHGGGGDIFDPVENARAAAHKLKSASEQFRAQYGRDPTGAELYTIHQQGWGGYQQHTAQPERAAWESMYATAEGQQKGTAWAKQAIWGNLPASERRRFGSVENITSGEFLDFWRQRYARAEGRAASAETPPAGGAPETGPDANQPTLGPQVALAFARQHLGEDEIADRSKLSAFFRSKGVSVDPATTAWCAGFVNANLQSAGIKGTGSLAAGSFTRWGAPIEGGAVQAGDVGVVRGRSPRTGVEGRHVGFLTGETRMGRGGLEVKMLGGNQPGTISGRGGVSEQWHPASRLNIRRATEREYRAMPDTAPRPAPTPPPEPAPSPAPEAPPAPAAPAPDAPAPEWRRPIDEMRGVREEMEEPIQLRFERDIGEEQFRRASMRREVDREVREARWDSFADIGAA